MIIVLRNRKFLSSCLLFFLLASSFGLQEARASRVFASAVGSGWDGVNDTQTFYDAISSSVDTVFIDPQAGPWVVGPTTYDNITDRVIIFMPGVEVVARWKSYLPSDQMIRFNSAERLTICGYGAELRMLKYQHTNPFNPADTTSNRHLLTIYGGEDIYISGLTLKDSGGDGIYLARTGPSGSDVPERVTIKDVVCDNGKRQGISITSAKDLHVLNCEFKNTSDQLHYNGPCAGVDIEPNTPQEILQGIRFSNCRFTGNTGAGITVWPSNLNDNSAPIGIVFEDCYSANNFTGENDAGNRGQVSIVENDTSAPGGNVVFDRCLLENSVHNGVYIQKPYDCWNLIMIDCVIRNVSTGVQPSGPQDGIHPIFFLGLGMAGDYGGAIFKHVLVEYNAKMPYFRAVNSGSMGQLGDLHDVQAVFTVANPYLSQEDIDPTPNNVNINRTNYLSLPQSTVEFVPNTIQLTNEGVFYPNLFGLDRQVTTHHWPLAVSYSTLGTPTEGLDYSLMSNFHIIRAYQDFSAFDFNVLNDTITPEASKLAILDLTAHPSYNIGLSNQGRALIQDGPPVYACKTGDQAQPSSKVPVAAKPIVFPNPFESHFELELGSVDSELGECYLVDVQGKRLPVVHHREGKRLLLEPKPLPAGVYWLYITVDGRSTQHKLLKK